MADYCHHAFIAQALRHRSGLFRVTGIILLQKLKEDGLAPQLRLLGIGLIHRQLHAIGHIFANMGNTTREWPNSG